VSLQNKAISNAPTAPVLAVIPCRNEQQHIERVVTKLLAEAERIDMNIVVADGGSTDGTLEIVRRLANVYSRVFLQDDPQIHSVALNNAVRTYGEGARFLIRIDAHAEYPDRYCEILLAVQGKTGADSVVVTMHTEGNTCFQRAAAAAQNSILGNGGASHRNESRGRWVDHGHHALMTLDAFKVVGGYDETFTHNEDAELDARLRSSGFRIFLTGEAPIIYFPRRTPVALFRQYFNQGRGRARNFLRHRRNTKLRHLILVGIAPIVVLLLLVPLSPTFAVPFLFWALLCIGYGLLLGLRLRDRCAAAAGIASMATQAGWSFGFFAGLFSEISPNGRSSNQNHRQFCRLQREPNCQMTVPVNHHPLVGGRPTVTVIMANYNGATHLIEAIESVQQQTLSELEIIVADDASTDKSVDIVSSLMQRDSRIRLIKSERNGGPAAARNRALNIAKGEWIAVMDSDDVADPYRLETLISAAERDCADIVADDLLEVDLDRVAPARRLLFGRWSQAPFWVDIVDYVRLNQFFGTGPAVGYLKPIFHASIFAAAAIRYDETLRIAEDYDLVQRLLHLGKRMRVYPLPLYTYHKHSSSISYRLNEAALEALLVSNRIFLDTIDPADRRLRTAVASRTRSIETALAYQRLLDAMKSGKYWRALAIAAARPQAAALLRLPLGVRLRRMVTAPRASGVDIAPLSQCSPMRPSADPGDAPLITGKPP
jgi:succinoglycan biosynthesis protein ExoA